MRLLLYMVSVKDDLIPAYVGKESGDWVWGGGGGCGEDNPVADQSSAYLRFH